MFQVNDVVVYGREGACEITGFEEKPAAGAVIRYLVLKPMDNRGTTLYVPADNERLLAKMRRLLTKKEIDALIDSMPGKPADYITNNTMRKEVYGEILNRGDHSELISLLRTLFFHKKDREAAGKRLSMADERIVKAAEQILYSEWQYVLHMDRDDLLAYIYLRIEKKECGTILN